MVEIGNTWDKLLGDEWDKSYYLKLRRALIHEYRTQTIYPDMYDIYNALKWTDYPDVNVVILGQDPYHGPGQAHGLSFSVQLGVRTPPSLLNIYKELESDLGCYIPNNGNLTHWAKQGVLLLNATLTVRAGSPNSHQSLGWDRLTDRIIECLNEREEPMVFFLWGNNARRKQALITNPGHLILTSVHPSPLSASRGFFGSKHFSKANAFLKAHGRPQIDWQIPNV